jgi:hypothetical protein
MLFSKSFANPFQVRPVFFNPAGGGWRTILCSLQFLHTKRRNACFSRRGEGCEGEDKNNYAHSCRFNLECLGKHRRWEFAATVDSLAFEMCLILAQFVLDPPFFLKFAFASRSGLALSAAVLPAAASMTQFGYQPICLRLRRILVTVGIRRQRLGVAI